jgi:SagB-type dehydrogenase family enzyme
MSSDHNVIYSLLESFDRDDRSATEDFHEASKLVPGGNKAFIRRTSLFMHALPLRHLVTRAWKDYSGRRSVPLPAASLPPMSLESALRNRRSLSNVAPAFGAQPMSLDQLASILGLSYGITGSARRSGPHDPEQPFRAAASAGGLYPLEIYPVVFNVDGLPSGIYHYSVRDHALDVLAETDDASAFLATLPQQDPWSTASVAFVVTAVLERPLSKYLHRGYRMAMNDCGALIQNLYLTTTGVGAIGCALAGFYDDRLGDLLGIDNVNEVVALCYVAGSLPGQAK